MKQLLPLAILLAACAPTTQDELTRAAARAAIKPVLAERFPGVPLDGAVDCAIASATGQEIVVLAADAVTGPTASTVEIVTRILTRPEAQTCLAREYVGTVLGAI